MSRNGFRNEKQPSRRDLQLALQQQKATNGQLLNHLQIMGPLMQRMMVASWQALRLAHRTRRDLDVAVSLPPKQTEEVKQILVKICDQVAEGAACWRESLEPDFVKADFMANIPKGIAAGEAFDEAVRSGDRACDLERTCTECDWAGFARECHVDSVYDTLLCPICDGTTKEVGDAKGEEVHTEAAKQVGEDGEGQEGGSSPAEGQPEEGEVDG